MSKPEAKDRHAGLLRNHGLKVTANRLVILDLLDQATEPQSAKAIMEHASAVRAMDRVTVYRALETLFKAGMVARDLAGGRAWLYHLTAGPDKKQHPHFHCSDCGSLACLPADTVKLDLKRLEDVFPAQVDHLRISLDGVCPDCLAKAGN